MGHNKSEAVLQPKRNMVWGAILAGLACLVFHLCLQPYKIGLAQLGESIRQNGFAIITTLVATSLLLLWVVFLAIVLRCRNRLVDTGKKLMARDARVLLSRDKRCPILYLRSFDHDEAETAHVHTNAELDMAKTFRKVGPVVAIGKPGETYPTLGAARLYVGDDWRQVVVDMIRKARFVVLRPGNSGSFWWEVSKVQELMPPTNIVFYFASAEDAEAFQNHAQGPIATPIDKSVSEALLTFDEDWRPILFAEAGRNRLSNLTKFVRLTRANGMRGSFAEGGKELITSDVLVSIEESCFWCDAPIVSPSKNVFLDICPNCNRPL